MIEAVFSSQGECLKYLTRRYNAFHLLEEIDSEGHTLRCTYDGAGRLIRQEEGEQRTDYLYNPQGDLTETRHFFGPGDLDYLATVSVYDPYHLLREENSRFFWMLALQRKLRL